MSNFYKTNPFYVCTCTSQNQVYVPSATHHPSSMTCRSPICSKLTGFNEGASHAEDRSRRTIDMLKEQMYQQNLDLFDQMILNAEITASKTTDSPRNVPKIRESPGASSKIDTHRFRYKEIAPKLEKIAGKRDIPFKLNFPAMRFISSKIAWSEIHM